jgi:hypothetical protein
MFDGTDLSMAYGSMYEMPPAPPQMAVNTQIPHTADIPLPKSTASHATPPDQQYAPPPAMYAQQSPTPKPMSGGDNFWDKLVAKRLDVIKLIILSMVVLLGISFDRVACHYLNGYIGKAFLTETQEFLIRLSYPVVVILILWIIKASA